MTNKELKLLLDQAADYYEKSWFIDHDPISIPKKYSHHLDIEVMAILMATISWGNRKSILNNGGKLVSAMGSSPFDFVMSANEEQLKKLTGFVHRTFNDADLFFFIEALKTIYSKNSSLEDVFLSENLWNGIANFRNEMFQTSHLQRTSKHISNPEKKSSCKRINMFLRWMVRSDEAGVDFGIWKKIKPSQLLLPLDVHTKKTALQLGFTSRKANDKKTVEEITEALQSFNSEDPIKYDFALFGLSAFQNQPSLSIFDKIWN